MTKDLLHASYAEIKLRQICNNLENIRTKVAPAKVMVILKANAYGHGVDGIAPYIAEYADYIGVGIVEEGIHLRQLGIINPFLSWGRPFPRRSRFL